MVTHNSALCLSSLCFAGTNFTPWYGEQVYDLRRHTQHLHQVVAVVGIKPWPPTQKPCFLTTTLSWLKMSQAHKMCDPVVICS